jgi:ParB/RepB/Spo0J family partition protein
MTRVALPQKPPEPSKQPPAPNVIFQGDVLISLIDVKEQVRKKFDENAHKELTESIRTKGVISPVTLRPIDNGFELVAGERRFRAAKAAGLAEIPAIVRELDDQSAALYQVEENIHRKDLTPIEEARGYKLLLEAKKYNVEQLAALVDKSKVYVYRSVSLLELPKATIEAIEKGETTPAHGHQILRVPPEHREKVWTSWVKSNRGETVNDLIQHIEYEIGKDLDKATFPLDAPYAGAVACGACPFNSANQGMLFDGATEGGQCTNVGCFNTKTKQSVVDMKAAFEKKLPNAKYVGQAENTYDLRGKIGRASELPREDINKAAVLKALTEKKDGVFWGLIASKWDAPHIVVWSTDNQVANRALGRKAKSSSYSSSGNESKPKSEKERFIEKAVAEHLEKKVDELRKKPLDTKTAIAGINKAIKGNYLNAAVKKLLPITEKNVAVFFFEYELDNQCLGEPDEIDARGGDSKKEKVEATKAAEAEWIKLHPKSAAAKGKK